MEQNLTFYLGTHILNHIDRADVPLFVSYRRLAKRKRQHFKQTKPLCVDSGGFSELSLYGEWQTTPEEYVNGLERLQGMGLNITWASQQDWMCEDFMLSKTGKTVQEHQRLTVDNLLELRALETDIHFIPVLQGQTLQDYFDHFEMFEVAGIDLRSEPTVGVGSVCRRQHSDEIGHIMRCLHAKGLKLHGFGVKAAGLVKYSEYLHSADSMAWSFNARYADKSEGCTSSAKNCANCLHAALEWREKVMEGIE